MEVFAADWDPSLHPRGPDGKFVEALGDIFGGLDFSRENDHGVLAADEQERLRENLADLHGEDVVEDFYGDYGWLNEWKAHRESTEGVRLGVAFARALDRDETEVKSYDKIDPDSVTDSHVELAEDLHAAGRLWFREKFGDDARMNRGFKDGGADMINALFSDPGDTVRLEGNSMDNWSWESSIAEQWGRKRSDRLGAIARTDRDIDDFIMTIDGVAGEYPSYNDSAVTFDGETEVSREDISLEVPHAAVRNYDDAEDRWASFEGSFFPARDVEEQDLDALKAFVLTLDDEGGIMGHFIDDGASDNFMPVLDDVITRLERELDPDDKVDSQILEAAEGARDTVERRW